MKTIKNISLFCGIVFSIFFVSFMVLAWSAPSSAPTGGNVAIPINESSVAQIKTGPLEVQGLFIAQSNVGIGTTSPRAKLTIADGGSPMGARFLDIGDDVYLTDIDLSNTLGIYGLQDITRSRIKLGSTGGIISGYNNNIGINQALPAYRLDVNGTGRFTGAVIVGAPTLDSHAATKGYVDQKTIEQKGSLVCINKIYEGGGCFSCDPGQVMLWVEESGYYYYPSEPCNISYSGDDTVCSRCPTNTTQMKLRCCYVE